MCWQFMFSNTVIAYNFTIPGRHEGQGLEAVLDTVIQLTRCARVTQCNNGLAAEGPECLLTPGKELPDHGAL
jgi:hypothetical protein